MENAGRGLARLARERFLGGDVRGRRVTVLVGGGGNGGGGLAGPRRLAGWGATVQVVLAKEPDRLDEVTRHQLMNLEHMGVPYRMAGGDDATSSADLIIDALIGYSLSGAPTGPMASLIGWANSVGSSVLSLDVPSGVDSETGTVYEPAIKATAILTLALPQEGLRAEKAMRQVGELYLADIGVPPELYARPSIGLEIGPVFAEADLLRIW